MAESMTIRFWGVRGGYPVPGEQTARYGGNTPCVEIQIGAQTIILDAGTGIIPLGKEMVRRAQESGAPIEALLLFSHLHHDHTQGFPFFLPTRFRETKLHLYGPVLQGCGPKEMLERILLAPAFPLSLHDLAAQKRFGTIDAHDRLYLQDGQIGVWTSDASGMLAPPGKGGVNVRALRSYAHPGGLLIYRIDWQGRSVVYAPDTEGYIGGDRRLIDFARDADLLIHDAQYTREQYLGLRGHSPTQGYGHSTAEMACEVASAAGVGQLALFHHDPAHDDGMMEQIEEEARCHFANTRAAFEGLEISFQSRVAAPPLEQPTYSCKEAPDLLTPH